MKKLLFLLVFLPSCEKEYCWDCELTTGIRHAPTETNWTTTTTQIVYCDKTKNEIDKIIAGHEYLRGMSSMSHMTCTKRK